VDGQPLTCDFCGECVEACPSGAMSNKLRRSWVRSWELRKTLTVCPLCTAGCRMELNVKDGKIFRVTGDPDSHNRGTLCAGGRFGHDFVHHEGRLQTPMLRQNGELRPVLWEEALAFVSEQIKRIVKESGPESVAGLGSPRLTNEDAYAFQKLFRAVIGTNNIDSEARFGFLRVQRALELTSGVRGAAGTLQDLLKTEAVLVVGLDPLEETPALGWQVKAAARRHDSNVIVANSRATSLDRFARQRLRIRPYSESDLILGLMKMILDLDLWDRKFVRDQTVNFLSMKNLLDKISLKGILKRTGVTAEALEEAARIVAGAANASVIFGGDVILQEHGLQCVMNLANLVLLTGNVGKPDAGLYPIFEKGNIVGLCDMGVLPEYLPGYQDTAAVRGLFERVWNTDLPYTRGKTVTEMAVALETGELRGLYVAAADPMTDYPHASRFAKAFAKAELLIVQDLFLSPTAKMAHCVLPAASFAEKDGTMTNGEHRLQKLNQALPPLGDAMPDWGIFEEVAKALGQPMGYFSSADVFREIGLTVPSYKGIRLRDLGGDGKILQPLDAGSKAAKRDRPYSFAPVRTLEAPEPEDAALYPYEMIAGRAMFHFGSTTTRSRNLSELCPEAFLEISHEDAAKLSVRNGDKIEVSSRTGSLIVPVKLSDSVSAGMVFVASNFPEVGVYRLFQENTTWCKVRLNRVS
jgi:formate dehydrogenase (NADP+) alpha subunit